MRGLVATGVLALFAGCVDDFQGSNIQFDFSSTTPVTVEGSHLTIYAFQSDPMAGRLFELERFEIHKIANLTSPCFIDVGEHVPHQGLHVSQYATVIGQDVGIPDITNPPPNATEAEKIEAATAVQRQNNVTALAGDMGIKAVTSASTSVYPAVGADCSDATGIPPPQCTDEVSNKRRLDMCQAAWKADPNFYEGTDRVLTEPLNGIAHGNVDGTNPINQAPIGGAQFYVDEVLSDFDGFALYSQMDGAASSEPGDLLLFGTPTMPTRGVIHVHLANDATPNLFAELAIFSDLGEDDVGF
ncbi:MAG: hypothetical protein QM831_24030 [Kofleriaceae bacterium]